MFLLRGDLPPFLYMKFQTFTVYILLFTGLTNCQVNPLYKPLAKSSSMDLVFYKTSKNKKAFTLKVTDKHLVNDMYVDLISTEDVPAKKCAFDGEIIFKYRNKNVLKVPFSLHPKCRYVTFTVKGEKYTRKLTPKGAEYLETARDTKWMVQN